MNAALKKIQARVKKLRKKHPGAKFRTLQKQAGAEYRAGKLKTKRKRSVGAVKKRKKVRARGRTKVSNHNGGGAPPVYMSHYTIGRAAPKRKRASVKKRRKPKTVTIIKYRKSVRYVKPKRIKTRRRKVGGMSKGTKNALLVGGAVVLGYLLMKSMSPSYPPVTLTNPASVASANSLVSAAQAAGYSATAIANLIKTINSSSDQQVQTAASTVNTGGTLPALYQTALISPDVSAGAPALVAPTLNFN
jgi:hypothetical protein